MRLDLMGMNMDKIAVFVNDNDYICILWLYIA